MGNTPLVGEHRDRTPPLVKSKWMSVSYEPSKRQRRSKKLVTADGT